MTEKIFVSERAQKTQKLAERIIKEILSAKGRKNAAVLALEGELGGGKTTFAQGLARALGVKEKITSPTFVIMRRFQLNNCPIDQLDNLYHIDCYRLKSSKELNELGIAEILKNPKNLVVIEWADKAKSLIPKEATWIIFKWEDQNRRKITVCQKFKY